MCTGDCQYGVHDVEEVEVTLHKFLMRRKRSMRKVRYEEMDYIVSTKKLRGG